MGQIYKIELYPAAEQDLSDITDDLNTLSTETALRYYDLLTERIDSLSSMPERCARPWDPFLAAKGYRYLVVKKYLVFFVVEGNTVQIHRILHAGSDYQSNL